MSKSKASSSAVKPLQPPVSKMDRYRVSLQAATYQHQLWSCSNCVEVLKEKSDRMYAVAASLRNRLEPKDENDDSNLVAWRLAELLCEMLGNVEFENRLEVGMEVLSENSKEVSHG